MFETTRPIQNRRKSRCSERGPRRRAAGLGRRGLVERFSLELWGKVFGGHVRRECMGVEPTTERKARPVNGLKTADVTECLALSKP